MPRVGRDFIRCTCFPVSSIFQSTHPVWGETSPRRAPSSRRTNFNPLAPCGARHPRPQVQGRRHRISIHSPAWGETLTYTRPCRRRIYFNPLAPCGARLASALRCSTAGSDFNPLAPCGARHQVCVLFHLGKPISIHSPRVGRDHRLCLYLSEACDFNPLAPCGARPLFRLSWHKPMIDFNPLAPCGARPAAGSAQQWHRDFNPLAPCGARPIKSS